MAIAAVAGKFGIRAKMYLAFALLAGLTVLVSFVAWRAFSFSSEALMRVADTRVPALVALSDLVQRSNGLSVAAPTVVLSTTDRDLQAQEHVLETAEGRFILALDALYQIDGQSARFDQVSLIAGRVSAHLQLLISAKRFGVAAQARYRQRLSQLDMLFRNLALLVETENLDRAPVRRYLNTGNRALTQLAEIGRFQETAAVEVVRRQVERLLDDMADILLDPALGPERDRLAPLLDQMRATALTDDGMVDLRAEEILAERVARDRLSDIQRDVEELNTLVSAWLWESRELVVAERATAEERLSFGELVLILLSLLSVAAAGLVGWAYVGRHVVGRIDRLNRSMRAIAGGNLDAPVPHGGSDEVAEMAGTLDVFRDALKEVRHLASHDRVTGIGNRNMLENEINRRLSALEGGAVVYINLSSFRELNDSFGLDFGDRVLGEVAQRLSDEEGLVSPSRLRSDHFGALVPGVTEAAELRGLGERLKARLSLPMTLKGYDVEVSPAVGIACFPRDGDEPESILRRADLAMNAAPNELGYRVYEPAVGAQAEHRETIRRDLKTAIDNGDIMVAYQPKLDLRTGAISSAEALVRWQHPTKGWISPGDFIPIAERSGLILELGSYVLRRACRMARAMMQHHGISLKIAVNVSPLQILQPDFVETVRSALSASGLAGEWLDLEVTESIFVDRGEDTIRRLEEVRRLGVGIAIDDFGTGYSSLSYLERLPVTCLKIDRAFVVRATGARPDPRTCRAILSMAQDFGLEVVAEGVETEEQLDFLRSEACGFVQGFLVSRPIFEDDLVAFIKAYDHRWAPRREVVG